MGLTPSATLIMLAMLASPSLVHAQSLVRGRVTDTTGAIMQGVEISVAGHGVNATTSATGEFRLDSVPAGPQTLIFRRIGFSAQQWAREFGGADTLRLTVVLGAVEVLLPEVVVVGRATAYSTKMETFERRRAASLGGGFLTDSILRTREHSTTSDVLRRVGGLRFVILPNGGGRAVVTSRSTNASFSVSRRDGCYSQIYLDGIRLWSMKDLPTSGPYNIDQHAVVDLQAIEVYRGQAQTPSELSLPDYECGTVVLWTRDR